MELPCVKTAVAKDAKLDYWERVITRIFHKGLETYVILRIWSLLDDDRVKFVPQQYVMLPNKKRALVDLYLPQIDIAIEVNEPYHAKATRQRGELLCVARSAGDRSLH